MSMEDSGRRSSSTETTDFASSRYDGPITPSDEYTIALEADPDDPEDRPVTVAGVKRALAERDERMRRAAESPRTEHVMLVIDQDILAKFRATGSGWQDRINDALRAASI